MKPKKGTILVLLLVLVAGIGLYLAYINNDISRLPLSSTGATLAELWTPADGQTRTLVPRESQATAATASGFSASNAATLPGDPGSKYAYRKEYGIYPGEASVQKGKEHLICVNSGRALPARYSANVKTEVCVTVYPENRQLEATAAKQFRKMYDAAMQEKDPVELIPFSGYRSTAQQKENFDREIDSLVAGGLTRQEAIGRAMQSIQPPGCSEHETGLAIDLTRKGVWRTDPGFHGTVEFNWLRDHAHEYGFILRYPQGKEHITGISYEPWHWRFVGVEAAEKIKTSGKCLEEYLGPGGVTPRPYS